MSVRNIINISVLIGAIWRNFVPPPANSVAFVPILVSAVQSASILVAVLMWFCFDYKYRSYYLKFLTWLTVASSINVPFDSLIQLSFWLFCVVSICIIMLPSYFPYSLQLKEKIKKTKHKNILVYSYPIFLLIISSVIFVFLINGIKIGDDLFMNLITDYAGSRHFSFFDSKLLLAGAGTSRSDIRPIMEIEKKDYNSSYLVGQVFDTYNDGLWEAPYDLSLADMPRQKGNFNNTLMIAMFEHLKGVVPAPRGVVAIEGKSPNYQIDESGIVINNDKNIPKATIFIDGESLYKTLKEVDIDKHLKISPFMKKHLKNAINDAVGKANTPQAVAINIQKFFTNNFEYDLYVDFKADDRGILYMIYRNKSAYCSYFATAMILMLRSQGVPARMATGFFASEESSWNKDCYIVRGRDAHAWVEALLPAIDINTGEKIRNENGERLYKWVRFDPTPTDSRMEALDKDSHINKFADWMWCVQKRIRAAILDIETKTLVNLLFVIIAILVFEEAFKKLIKTFMKKQKTKKELNAIKDDKRKALYLSFYKTFEEFLKTKFDMTREKAETGTELITRLRREDNIPQNTTTLMESFLFKYHAARFGLKEEVDLNSNLKIMLETYLNKK
ncbi:MAG: transglutaminase-like domain-containing protein [Candidatus Omnitrophica bacterium]|nr:transglutaminase-like domain-containing protein [Candidatus Omnitrophota bacterium]